MIVQTTSGAVDVEVSATNGQSVMSSMDYMSAPQVDENSMALSEEAHDGSKIYIHVHTHKLSTNISPYTNDWNILFCCQYFLLFSPVFYCILR